MKTALLRIASPQWLLECTRLFESAGKRKWSALRIRSYGTSRLVLFPRFLLRPSEGKVPAGHAGQYLVEGLLSRHFFLALVLAVAVLKVTGPAAHLLNFVAGHDYNGMIGGAHAARAVIVDVIAQPHKTSSKVTPV